MLFQNAHVGALDGEDFAPRHVNTHGNLPKETYDSAVARQHRGPNESAGAPRVFPPQGCGALSHAENSVENVGDLFEIVECCRAGDKG
jgi:hypothetical protein